MIGNKIGRLSILELPVDGKVRCLCECGKECLISARGLFSKKPTQSCGCLQKEKASKRKHEPKQGDKCNMLTFISEAESIGKHRRLNVVCDCGKTTITRLDKFVKGLVESCGCIRIEKVIESNTTHGAAKTPTYTSWMAMKQRCDNPKASGYKDYGGRGITYDPRWKEFKNFLEDMGERPKDKDLNRIDPYLNYSKDNCNWADRSEGTHGQRLVSGQTSKYKGIYYDVNKNLWIARLKRDGVFHLRKGYRSEIEAAKAYDDVSEQIYGDRPNKKLIEAQQEK